MYIYIYIYITYKHTYTYTSTFTPIPIPTPTPIPMPVQTYIYLYVYISIHTHCVYMYIYIHMYVHISSISHDTPLRYRQHRQYHGYGQELDGGHGRLSDDCESGGCCDLFRVILGEDGRSIWLYLQTVCTFVYSSIFNVHIHII